MGWYVGGFFLICYACICFYIGLKKPEKILIMAKKKLGGASDKVTVMLCYMIAAISIIAGVVLLYLGYINQ